MTHSITPRDPDYSGPDISFRWVNSAGVAYADDSRAAPWVMTPAPLLARLAAAAEDADPGTAAEARDLLRESRTLLRVVPADVGGAA